jgi:nucleolar protein 14
VRRFADLHFSHLQLERQQQKELDEDIRMELDEGLDDLRELLNESIPTDLKRGKANLDFYKAPAAAPAVEDDDDAESKTDKKKPETDGDYDQFVRSLAFDRRAKPKDRTKTEEEVAKEEAEKLQEAEAARLKRMRGIVDEDEDEEEGGRKRRRQKGGRAPEADDLDDDYADGYEDDAQEFGLGAGLGGRQAVEDGDEEMIGEDEDEEGESDEDDDEDDDDLEEGDEDMEDDLASDLELDDDAKVKTPTTGSKGSKQERTKKARSTASEKVIPFTFKCPESYDDFEAIIDGLEDKDVETVVKRIRTLYHPSLGEGNKERLQELLGILMEHIINRGSESNQFSLTSLLMPHINGLVNLNVLSAAEHFKEKLAEMHAILLDKLENARSDPSTSIFPEAGDLAILRMVGTIWSTSDFSHPVSVPAALYMGQCLSQAPVRDTGDFARGLFMSAIFLQVSPGHR